MEFVASVQNGKSTAIILQHFNQNPSTSTQRSDSALGISSTVIWKTLLANGSSIPSSTCPAFTD